PPPRQGGGSSPSPRPATRAAFTTFCLRPAPFSGQPAARARVASSPVRVTGRAPVNRQRQPGVGQGMRIDQQHLCEPGLVVLDVTAADEATLHTVMDRLQQQWATSGITPVRRHPGAPGVKARIYADTRRPGAPEASAPAQRRT
ncbi:DUF6207 family protein, partial [Streptomyces sp. URMC 123]|uniref:DUF6207 family protein n=1 Tax=Streptomyces sp. URMC 123 TaxID=3423403 RepID=UPI003F1D58D6